MLILFEMNHIKTLLYVFGSNENESYSNLTVYAFNKDQHCIIVINYIIHITITMFRSNINSLNK